MEAETAEGVEVSGGGTANDDNGQAGGRLEVR